MAIDFCHPEPLFLSPRASLFFVAPSLSFFVAPSEARGPSALARLGKTKKKSVPREDKKKSVPREDKKKSVPREDKKEKRTSGRHFA
jgi:hypothetical protein